MMQHLPMLSATVIPAGSLLLLSLALRPDPDWARRHRPGSGRGMVPAAAIISALDDERRSGALPTYWFGSADRLISEEYR